ncbi:MAG TPA: DegV family protein [Bacilli bacterium]|nr:DegV family protein [Bacilli bacterium]
MKIAISSDSTLSITQAESKELGIYVMPLNVIVDGKEYHDDIDISKEELVAFMRAGSRISTSTPTPVEIETFFNDIFAQGYDHIVHFTISSKLSSMFELFTITCKNLYGDKVTVIDSLSVCSFMANHVLAAKKFRDEGMSPEQITEKISKRIAAEYIIFVPESLTFLKNGGRVSPTVAAIGNLIGLKPILSFQNGEIGKKGATRKLKNAIDEQLVEMKKTGYDPKKFSIDILQFDTSATNIELMYHFLERHFPDFDIHLRPLSINVCAHTGPGTIGFGMNLKTEADI